uniref:Uncharacterized protein n=1 Tax=Oryza meridionalis TaxID=40149 RepID=A0A0E0CX89_9ORYZ
MGLTDIGVKPSSRRNRLLLHGPTAAAARRRLASAGGQCLARLAAAIGGADLRASFVAEVHRILPRIRVDMLPTAKGRLLPWSTSAWAVGPLHPSSHPVCTHHYSLSLDR